MDLREINYVLLLATTGRAVLPSEVAALDDPENTAHPADREEGRGLSNTTLSAMNLNQVGGEVCGHAWASQRQKPGPRGPG